jgi:HPt (histidine-containing phosphotransfer) domain-containing protein
MTAHALKGDRERCFAAGMDDYIAKPVKLETIKELLEKWMPPDGSPAATVSRSTVELSDRACLDTGLLQSWRSLTDDGEDDFLTEVIDIFLHDTPGILAELCNAIEKGDARLTQRYGHKLKGSSANLGAVLMAEVCAELEALGNSGDIAGAGALIQRLELEFQRARTQLLQDWHSGQSTSLPLHTRSAGRSEQPSTKH